MMIFVIEDDFRRFAYCALIHYTRIWHPP
jgi:hypothetical protein